MRITTIVRSRAAALRAATRLNGAVAHQLALHGGHLRVHLVRAADDGAGGGDAVARGRLTGVDALVDGGARQAAVA